jgi:DHA1 family tetracycline resistance protein-like MFS transporter
MRKASLFTIFLIVFIDLVGFGIVLPNQQLYGELLGIHDKFYLTLIGPAYSFFQFLFAPILGRWSDRVGRRPVLILSQAGILVSYFFLFSCTIVTHWNAAAGIFLLYFSRVFAGITAGNISIATAYIADITTSENRAKGMGVIGAAFGIGFVCGPAIGAFVSPVFGLQYVPISAALFSATALTLTIFTLPESLTLTPASSLAREKTLGELEDEKFAKQALAADTNAQPREAVAPEGLRRFSVTGLRHALARPAIGAMIWMVFVNGFAFAGMEQTLSLLIQDRAFGGADTKAALDHVALASGVFFSCLGIILAVIQGGLIGPLTKAFGETRLTVIGPFFNGLGLFLVGAAGTLLPGVWPFFAVGGVLLAVGSSLFNPSVQALISRHAGTGEQGEILGAMQGMASLARATGPLLAGFLYSRFSSGAPYYASAVICLVVALWAAASHHQLAPPPPAAEVPGGFPVEPDVE